MQTFAIGDDVVYVPTSLAETKEQSLRSDMLTAITKVEVVHAYVLHFPGTRC